MNGNLSHVFNAVNQQKEFAAKKNAALFAANLILSYGYFKHPGLLLPNDPLAIYFCYIASALLILSASICLASFIPKIVNPITGENLMFHGNIAKFTAEKFLDKLEAANVTSAGQRRKWDIYIAEHTIERSRAIGWKFRAFGLALRITLLVMVITTLYMIYLAVI